MQSTHIKVKVKAGAKKEKFTVRAPDIFDIEVKEEAHNNMANARVRTLVAKHLEVSLSLIRIVSGHHSPSKIIVIGGR